jgi:hypothetical protein
LEQRHRQRRGKCALLDTNRHRAEVEGGAFSTFAVKKADVAT